MRAPASPESGAGLFQKLFEAVTGKWVAGETARRTALNPGMSSVLRVERGVVQVMRGITPAASAVIFTSAGPIGAAVRLRAASVSGGHAADVLDVAQRFVQRVSCVGREIGAERVPMPTRISMRIQC